MIQANELRIGNWIFICEKENNPIQVSARLISYLSNAAVRGDNHPFAPIPLSPDILEKAGFKPNAVGDLSIEINDISTHLELREANGLFYPSIDQMQDIGSPQNVALNCIQYLHQLQNIIHALTGQELTITLTPNTNL